MQAERGRAKGKKNALLASTIVYITMRFRKVLRAPNGF